MNTIKKIIASSVVNAIPACFLVNTSESFGKKFVYCSILSGLPVIADKYINQNIISNKAIQYGLTAAEAVVGFSILRGFEGADVGERFSVDAFKKFIGEVCSTDCGNDTKFITGLITYLSLTHKYIWDQPNDTNFELDQSEEIIINIDALEII